MEVTVFSDIKQFLLVSYKDALLYFFYTLTTQVSER